MVTVRVSDFQSITEATLDAEGLTVISGPSDRGKSALLRAIESALFNRPGDQFVRVGQSAAQVDLGLDGHVVSWRKGRNVNRFTVDGVEFSKVGVKAPAPLQGLGFRDVLIGARLKDDGKFEGGEWIRPQVAGQFDAPFLLKASGSFLAETLVGLARLHTLQRAGRLCSLDLRTQRALLAVRREDLTKVVAARDQLAEVPALRARLTALKAQADALDQRGFERDQLATLLAERARLVAALATAAAVVVPDRPPIPDVARLAQLRTLTAERARLVAQLAVPLPKKRTVKKTMVAARERLQALAPLVAERAWAIYAVEQARATVDTLTARGYQLDLELETLKAELKICPTCGQPFPTYGR